MKKLIANTNLIGVHGKINSGKDTVGAIIQYLTSDYYPDKSFMRFLEKENSDWGPPRYDWEIRKFADKLKEIVCLLIGCTREQLEDREFKETPLGEEWKVYKIDYQTDYDDIDHDHSKIFLSEEDAINWYEPLYLRPLRGRYMNLTPRLLLQLLGTEAGRQIIHPNIWVNALFADYKLDHGVVIEPNWIITDVRFPNEAKAIADRGGILIKVVRPETDHLAGDHESETALDQYVGWDLVLDNSKDFDYLIQQLESFFIKREKKINYEYPESN